MLFPSMADVNEVWAAVAGDTVKGHLGIAAKVVTNEGSRSRGGRLICVYTSDFEDKTDVKSVLVKLRDMGLVEKPIYYKCDAYTWLNVESQNPYGLKASMFSRRDVLGHRA